MLADPNPAQTALIRQLKRLMEKLDDMKTDRRRLIEDAKRATTRDDIRPAVMREAGRIASAEPGTLKIEAAHFEPMFDQELRKYQVFSQSMEMTSQEQDSLLDKIKVCCFDG